MGAAHSTVCHSSDGVAAQVNAVKSLSDAAYWTPTAQCKVRPHRPELQQQVRISTGMPL